MTTTKSPTRTAPAMTAESERLSPKRSSTSAAPQRSPASSSPAARRELDEGAPDQRHGNQSEDEQDQRAGDPRQVAADRVRRAVDEVGEDHRRPPTRGA